MLTARNAHAIVKCEESFYVLGGYSGKDRLNTVERYYEDQKQWKNVSPMK
jgi:hypothetical protein